MLANTIHYPCMGWLPSLLWTSFVADLSCNYAELLESVVDVFKPGIFTLSLILVNTTETAVQQIAEEIWSVGQTLGLVGRHKTHLQLDNGHQLFFVAFMKPSKLPPRCTLSLEKMGIKLRATPTDDTLT